MAGRSPQDAPSRRTSRPSAARKQPARRGTTSASRSAKSPATKRSSARRNTTLSYNTPSLWTKEAPRSHAESAGPVRRVVGGLGKVLLMLLSLLGRGLAALGRGLFSLLSRSRVALVAFVLIIVVAGGLITDYAMNAGKVYPGVKVGEVDASGKTADEVAAALKALYEPRLEGGSVTVYVSEDAAARVADELAAAQDAALAEQVAVEEARANKQAWTVSAADLSAQVPAEELAAAALAVGREDGGLGARLGALFAGRQLEMRAAYRETALEELASEIDLTVGNPRVDFNVEVEEGVAHVAEGHAGEMLDRDAFARSLDTVLLGEPDGTGSFVAAPVPAPLRIDEAAAQVVCDQVNAALHDGARIRLDDAAWDVTASELGEWVAMRVEEREDATWALVPYLDEARTKPGILAHVERARTGEAPRIEFAKTDAGVEVRTDGATEIPLVAETTRALEQALFGEGAATSRTPGQPAEATVAFGPAPASLSFDEALDLGLISEVSSYTTEFTTGAGTENRNHNIELVSNLLSDSIVKPNGTWSFNETAGECNADRGFLGAGAIIDGEYDDAVGGGICQVATTVFNAVYESGYPVVRRHNHSLYIASYPAGRDAAVSWPDLDLVWKNDAASDVLVRVSCVDGAVTATLYGVDPGYRVTSQTGEWGEGEKHKTKTETDETLAPGTSYVKTRGTDGSTISVVRTVTDEAGAILHEDPFYSVYDPLTEVVVEGPKVEEDKTTEEKAAA